MAEPLLERIRSKQARVGVIGLGYVGLPLVVEFAAAGLEAVGFDIVAEKVEAIKKGNSYIADVPASRVGALVRSGHLSVTTDFSLLSTLDTINICVPTPLSEDQLFLMF